MEQFSDTYESFKLKKIQLQKTGLKCEYEIEERIGEETYSNVHKIASAVEIHKDMRKLFVDMREWASRILNMNVYQALAGEAEIGNKLNEKLLGFSEEWIKSLSVTSVIVSGKGENRGIVLAGEYESPSGCVSFKTPKIKFEADYLGYESQIESCFTDLEYETYQYLFEGKMAELSTFGE